MNWPLAVHSWAGGARLLNKDSHANALFLRSRVAELEAAIQEYLNKHNADPKPFVWTASAAAILEKVRRGRQALELVH